MPISRLMVALMLAATSAAIAKPGSSEKRTRPTQAIVDQIRKDCGITSQQFNYDDEGISFKYDGMIEGEKVDCARDRTILLGVGFDSYDLTAPYSGPRRFIIKGPPKRLETVGAEASALNWIVTEHADGGKGFAFLEIETGANFTRREVSAFLDRFIMSDLRDIAVGLAPTSLAGYDLPDTATDFRVTARHMYERLGTRSCGSPPGFDREALLKPDRDAVARLDRELSATIAGPHLAIAREDAAYELSKKPDSCWADEDVRFAKRHVEMVHDSVSAGSSRLRRLAPVLDPLPVQQSPANAPEFRYRVRQLTVWMLPLCSWTTKGNNQQIFAASSAEVQQFEARLKGTPYALHYAVAKDDESYERSGVTAECDDPGADSVSKLSGETLATTRKQIEQIAKLTLP